MLTHKLKQRLGVPGGEANAAVTGWATQLPNGGRAVDRKPTFKEQGVRHRRGAVFAVLAADRKNEHLMLDSPRPPAGRDWKRGAKTQALGRSRGGLTTKIHMLADALGRPLKAILTPGQAHDVVAVPALLDRIKGGSVIADKGYDTNEVRTIIKTPIPHDPVLYKARNRIERCFNKLKHFRRIATRYDRRDIHFLSFIHLASAMLWMR